MLRSPSLPDPVRPRRCQVLSSALLLAVAAGPAAAQASNWQLEPFAARQDLDGARTLGGLSLRGNAGILGVRASGAVAWDGMTTGRSGTVQRRTFCDRRGCRSLLVNSGASSMNPFGVGQWTADMDLLVEPFRQLPLARQLLLGFSPYAFAGVGRQRLTLAPGSASDSVASVWSYGAGVQHTLVGGLGVSAEARVRRHLQSNALVGASWRNATQYRVGLTVALGGARRRSASPPPPVVSAPPVIAAVEPPPAAPATLDPMLVPRLLDAADELVGVRWQSGGSSPNEGFDAGGLVQHLLGQQGIRVSRFVSELAASGVAVPTRVGALRPGDLLLFAGDGVTPDHVGIYVGRERFVHASASGNGVRYDVLGESSRGLWFAERLVGARRVVLPGAVLPAATPTVRPSGRPDAAPPPAGAQ